MGWLVLTCSTSFWDYLLGGRWFFHSSTHLKSFGHRGTCHDAYTYLGFFMLGHPPGVTGDSWQGQRGVATQDAPYPGAPEIWAMDSMVKCQCSHRRLGQSYKLQLRVVAASCIGCMEIFIVFVAIFQTRKFHSHVTNFHSFHYSKLSLWISFHFEFLEIITVSQCQWWCRQLKARGVRMATVAAVINLLGRSIGTPGEFQVLWLFMINHHANTVDSYGDYG